MRWAHTCHAIPDVAIRQQGAHIRLVDATPHDDAHGAKPMTDLAALSKEQLIAMLTQASAPKALTMKVSEKGALSVYGLGRFPVTLYRGQWGRLLAAAPQIEAFVAANAALLAVKA